MPAVKTNVCHPSNHQPPKPLSHNVAAASTAPAPLNAAGLETTISTGYFHSMNFAHPAHPHRLASSLQHAILICTQLLSTINRSPASEPLSLPNTPLFPLFQAPKRRSLTPISNPPPKILPRVRNHHHCKQELQLLKTFFPFSFCIRSRSAGNGI